MVETASAMAEKMSKALGDREWDEKMREMGLRS
jgi:hypothetical protein